MTTDKQADTLADMLGTSQISSDGMVHLRPMIITEVVRALRLAALRAPEAAKTIRDVPHEDCLNCRCEPGEQCAGVVVRAPEAGEAKPVAWRSRHVNYVDWVLSTHEPPRDDIEKQPLYAAPVSADAGLVEALKRITDILGSAGGLHPNSFNLRACCHAYEIAQAALAAAKSS